MFSGGTKMSSMRTWGIFLSACGSLSSGSTTLTLFFGASFSVLTANFSYPAIWKRTLIIFKASARVRRSRMKCAKSSEWMLSARSISHFSVDDRVMQEWETFKNANAVWLFLRGAWSLLVLDVALAPIPWAVASQRGALGECSRSARILVRLLSWAHPFYGVSTVLGMVVRSQIDFRKGLIMKKS